MANHGLGATRPNLLIEDHIKVISPGEKDAIYIQTDKDGRFELPLRPGSYTLEVPSFLSKEREDDSRQTVMVKVDQYAQVDLKIDRDPVQ